MFGHGVAAQGEGGAGFGVEDPGLGHAQPEVVLALGADTGEAVVRRENRVGRFCTELCANSRRQGDTTRGRHLRPKRCA